MEKGAVVHVIYTVVLFFFRTELMLVWLLG